MGYLGTYYYYIIRKCYSVNPKPKKEKMKRLQLPAWPIKNPRWRGSPYVHTKIWPFAQSTFYTPLLDPSVDFFALIHGALSGLSL